MVAFPTAVNAQITDAVEPGDSQTDAAGEAPAAEASSEADSEGDTASPAGGGPGEPGEPGDTVIQAVLLSIGSSPAKSIGTALASMAQAAGLQMAGSAASYQSWSTVQRSVVTQAASEIFASTFDAPAGTGRGKGA